ncbi:MAG: hypothetical protein ACHRXM_37410 [Isosphaerales bacterium]
MGGYRHKVVVDPVHGAIGLSKVETDVVNTAAFQRLRRLKQLGLASLVYPTADHSRFAHSLGVFHRLADRERLPSGPSPLLAPIQDGSPVSREQRAAAAP